VAIPYREVIASPELAAGFVDATMIDRYLDAGSSRGELLYLGFGETWTQVAPGLASALAHPAPSHVHGYVISQYGLPRLQRALRAYIGSSHRLPAHAEPGAHYEVAVTSGGTRSAMFDFARTLLLDPTLEMDLAAGRRPIVIAQMPGWDYAGVAEDLGYGARFLRLRHGMGHQPSADEFDGLVAQVAADPASSLALVVINAQHNPTGQNWDQAVVRHMIRGAFKAGAAVLIDDAYYGVHDPGVVPTSALAILLDELHEAPPAARRRWLAVRSLGKQFHCSGWGLGAATAHPDTLRTAMHRIHLQHGFATAIPLQHAMSTWLESPASQRYLDESNRAYAGKRDAVVAGLQSHLGYPAHTVHRGVCGGFMRAPLPHGYRSAPDPVHTFRQDVLDRTGVLVGVDRWTDRDDDEPPCFRLYLGPPQGVLIDALTRLQQAGFHYGRET